MFAALALGVAMVACESATTGPGDGPRLSSAKVSAADPPPDGEPFAVQVGPVAGGVRADLLVPGRVDCTRVGAGLEVEELTLVLTIQTTPRSGCPTAGGILVRSTIVGLEPGPSQLLIVHRHEVVPAQVDTVFTGTIGE